MRFYLKSAVFSAIACGLCTLATGQSTGNIRPGDTVAICGDSITEQHIYSVDIESYLTMCKPIADVKAMQFGWGGETAEGFKTKMPQFMLPFGATVATTCYGMNDGHYRPLDDATAKNYLDNQTAVIENLKKANVHFIVLGSPGAVDSTTFRKDPEKALMYNKTLGSLRDIDRDLARQQGVAFADVHQAMLDAMEKAKAKYGADYVFAGNDGVHPGQNGHLVMAYAFLKAMGFDGDIGTITIDLAGNTAKATDGHTILATNGGVVQIQSTRYPFCFSGDPATADATAGMIQFCPFNQDLNRFMLVVNNPGADRLKVTFGESSKEFSATDLAKGINLAGEFLDNPFSRPFAEVMAKIKQKQGIETMLDKNFYNSIPQLAKEYPGAKAAYEAIQEPIQKVLTAQACSIAGLVQPVKYQIKIEAVK